MNARLNSYPALVALTLLGLLALSPTQAATYVVNSTLDTDGSTCGNPCSLRQAINAANSNPGTDEIVVPAGIFQIGSALTVSRPVIIRGAGSGSTIIQTSAISTGGVSRIFHVAYGLTGDTTIQDLTLRHAKAPSGDGGALLWQNWSSAGNTLSLTNVVIADAINDGGDGGAMAVLNMGAYMANLTLQNVTVRNSTANRGHGGGLFVGCNMKVTIENSLFEANMAAYGMAGLRGGDGGGLFLFGACSNEVYSNTVSNTHFRNNTARAGTDQYSSSGGAGGGLYVAGEVAITGGEFSGNTADRDGGGLYLSALSTGTTLSSLTITGNTAKQRGGGIYALGPFAMSGGSISQNLAHLDGGGIAVNLDSGQNASLSGLSVANNAARNNGGGLHLTGAMSGTVPVFTLADTSVTGNTADSDSAFGGSGGGLYQTASMLTVSQSGTTSISGNQCLTCGWNDVGGVVYPGPLAVADSLAGTLEDTPYTIAHTQLLANDLPHWQDETGSGMRVSGVSAALNGTVTSTDTQVVFTPAADYFGPAGFSYILRDSASGATSTAQVTFNVAAVADMPVAEDVSGLEDTPIPLSITPNPVDLDSVTHFQITGIMGGTLFHADGVTVIAEGAFITTAEGAELIFLPAPDANSETELFSVTVKAALDEAGAGLSVAKVIAITVVPVNDPPVAHDDSYTLDEDTVLVVAAPGVLGNDTDVEGSPLTAILESGSAHGVLILDANGSFTYTPFPNFFGEDSFTYRAYDGELSSQPATVTLTINPVNDPPVAVNDSYSVDQDTTLTVAAEAGVLANDFDVDGDALAALLVEDVQHGNLMLNGDGSFTYTPDADFHGTDGFTYRASDGLLTSELASVTITVNYVAKPAAMPIFGLTAGSYETTQTLAITTATPDASIYYTLDGSEPTTGSLLYSGPISFGEGSVVVRAFATKDDWLDSAIAVAEYTFYAPVGMHDGEGDAIEARTLSRGASFTFSIAGGSGNYDVTVSPNPQGVVAQLVQNDDGSWQFVAPTTGAFAGDYVINIHDLDTGAVRQITFTVSLAVAVDRPSLLGSVGEVVLTIRGAEPGTSFTAQIVDELGDSVDPAPVAVVTSSAAAADSARGNPGTLTLRAGDVVDDTLFAVRVDAGTLLGVSRQLEVIAAAIFTGHVVDAGSGAVPGATVRADEVFDALYQPYTTETDAGGQFTLLAPKDTQRLLAAKPHVGSTEVEADGCAGEGHVCTLALSMPGTDRLTGASGVALVSSTNTHIALDLHSQPVVIAGVPGFRGSDGGVARVTNVTQSGFDLRFARWDYLGGRHTRESTAWVALLPGRYHLPDGSLWEVGRFDLSGTGSFWTRSFSAPFPGTPRLFLTAQTENEDDVVTVRARSVTPEGFRAALFEQESKMDGHVTESVGYLAIYNPADAGQVELNGEAVNYTLEGAFINQNFREVLDGRYQIRLREEQSLDEEMAHTNEDIDVMLLGDGLYGQDVSTRGRDTASLRHR